MILDRSFYTRYEQTMIDKFHHECWVEKLKVTINSDSFKKLGAWVATRRTQVPVYPDSNDIFNAFRLHINKIKIVVISQEPYCDPNSDGLAFSTKLHMYPPALKQILNKRDKEYPSSFNSTMFGSLKEWHRQGVFLYNTLLTVEKQPKSHENKGWELFSKDVITAINETQNNIVYILIGNDAKRYKQFINEKNNLIIECEHPALSVQQRKEWNNSQCFTKANDYLINNNKTPIEW
jgi:uracil-DNA glycosylase